MSAKFIRNKSTGVVFCYDQFLLDTRASEFEVVEENVEGEGFSLNADGSAEFSNVTIGLSARRKPGRPPKSAE